MLVAAVRLIEYRTEDGSVFRLQVSAEVAAVLQQTERGSREDLFTDVSSRGPDGKPRPLDPDTLDPTTVRRRIDQRKAPKGYPWEGPRFSFGRILGEGRIWSGPPSPGDFCGWEDLSPGTYCLCCERTGRDDEIPVPSRADLDKRRTAAAYVPPETRKGQPLKGGMGGSRPMAARVAKRRAG